MHVLYETHTNEKTMNATRKFFFVHNCFLCERLYKQSHFPTFCPICELCLYMFYFAIDISLNRKGITVQLYFSGLH